MNEHQFGDKIRKILEHDAQPDARTLERLRKARELALARKRPEHVPALAWVGQTAASGSRSFMFWARVALPALLLVVGLVGIYGWQQRQKVADRAELDALLLSDDLPIDAYLDKGFQAWLKKQSGG
jgi:predicted signal transduction protein with EAL and GGDEF domain